MPLANPDTVSATTLAWWNQMGPWKDADTSRHLLTLLDSLGYQHDQTEQYTRDSAGYVGWGKLMDPNACPVDALPWLAQFPGVIIPQNADEASTRALIAGGGNIRKGTVAGLIAAAQVFLVGVQKRVDVYERTPDPYSFKVVTYTDETPDQTAVLNAMIAAKPAGLIMSYVVDSGPRWDQMVGTWAVQTDTWAGEANEVPVIP